MSKLFEYIDTLTSPYEAFTVVPSYNGFPVRPHWHYYMEVIYMISGQVQVDSDKESFVLSEGDIFVFFPKSIHSISAYNKSDFEYGVLKFDISRLTSQSTSTPSLRVLFDGAYLADPSLLYFNAQDLPTSTMQALFWTCFNEVEHKDFGYDLVLHSSLCSFLIELVRVMKSRGFNTDAAISLINSNTTIDTITEYIDNHSSEHIAVGDLSDMCNMSYSYFAKSFKQIYGRSCKEHIEFVRISKAEDLLLYTDFDLTYISQETGFSDCSHLIKTFKKWKGITPKQFRLKRAHS